MKKKDVKDVTDLNRIYGYFDVLIRDSSILAANLLEQQQHPGEEERKDRQGTGNLCYLPFGTRLQKKH